jgi:hypothetical protein
LFECIDQQQPSAVDLRLAIAARVGRGNRTHAAQSLYVVSQSGQKRCVAGQRDKRRVAELKGELAVNREGDAAR